MKQRGFTLLEMSIALTLMAGLSYMWLLSWSTESQRLKSKLAGQQYRIIQDALNDYLALFHDDLLKLPNNCSQIAYAARRSLSVPAEISSGACAVTLPAVNAGNANVAIRNGLQPSIEEFKSLRLVDQTFRNSLMLPTEWVVATPNGNVPSPNMAPPQYAVQISKVCAAPNCYSYQLTGLIFNTQPYSLVRNNSMIRGIDILTDALAAAGPDAALSTNVLYSGDSELHGWNNLFTLTNPLRDHQASGSPGLSGVLAVRTGYGSASMSQFARLDGSRNITGNWNFSNHSVTGIQQLSSTDVTTQQLGTRRLTTNSAEITNDLRVNGVTDINVGRFGNIVLPYTWEGQGCYSNWGSLAMSYGGKLLVCQGGVWTVNN